MPSLDFWSLFGNASEERSVFETSTLLYYTQLSLYVRKQSSSIKNYVKKLRLAMSSIVTSYSKSYYRIQ